MNLRPSAPKADALPSCATPRIQFHGHWFVAVELPEGFEPSTVRLQGGCSAVELEQHRRPEVYCLEVVVPPRAAVPIHICRESEKFFSRHGLM